MHPERSFSALGGSRSSDHKLGLVCKAFEQAWRSGQRPKIAQALVGVEPASREALLVELILVEAALRREAGETVARQEI